MNIQTVRKESFCVIGKEGSTDQGQGFVQRLWQDANDHFDEIQHLAKRNEQGNLIGIWGAMTDFSRQFHPWTNDFSEGLYLAGVQCDDDAAAPSGWAKWTIPGFEYLILKCEVNCGFAEMIRYLADNNVTLAGAVHDFTDPTTDESYMYFPVRKL